jgi:hypothetical protein
VLERCVVWFIGKAGWVLNVTPSSLRGAETLKADVLNDIIRLLQLT